MQAAAPQLSNVKRNYIYSRISTVLIGCSLLAWLSRNQVAAFFSFTDSLACIVGDGLSYLVYNVALLGLPVATITASAWVILGWWYDARWVDRSRQPELREDLAAAVVLLSQLIEKFLGQLWSSATSVVGLCIDPLDGSPRPPSPPPPPQLSKESCQHALEVATLSIPTFVTSPVCESDEEGIRQQLRQSRIQIQMIGELQRSTRLRQLEIGQRRQRNRLQLQQVLLEQQSLRGELQSLTEQQVRHRALRSTCSQLLGSTLVLEDLGKKLQENRQQLQMVVRQQEEYNLEMLKVQKQQQELRVQLNLYGLHLQSLLDLQMEYNNKMGWGRSPAQEVAPLVPTGTC